MFTRNIHVASTQIIGTGGYAPEKIITNADLEKIVNTSDAWITERTGIKERRLAVCDGNCGPVHSNRQNPPRPGDRGRASDADYRLGGSKYPRPLRRRGGRDGAGSHHRQTARHSFYPSAQRWEGSGDSLDSGWGFETSSRRADAEAKTPQGFDEWAGGLQDCRPGAV